MGIDSHRTKVLKFTRNEVAEPIQVLINSVIISGTFPAALKIIKIVPVFKKGDHKCIENYWSISIFSIIMKR